MNFWEIHKHYLNLKRFQEIAYVFTRRGFGDLLEVIGLEDTAISIGKKAGLIRKDWTVESRPFRLRLALEELGPTFIKLGQILSTREDLLPQSYIEELQKLQEQATPIDFVEIRSTLLKSLDITDLSEVFLNLEEKPIATASIGQVHRATLKDHTQVIVKIRKPRVQEVIQTDLDILSTIAGLLQEQFGPHSSADWSGILENFIKGILKELDFRREARMMYRFSIMLPTEEVKIPEVYSRYSSDSIMIMEYVDGLRLTDPQSLKAAGLDQEELAKRLIQLFFEQVFEHGCFHGDPHPGNLRVRSDGRIVFYDFGMTGQLNEELMFHIVRMFYAAAEEDFSSMARSVAWICTGSVSRAEASMHAELKDLVATYRNQPLDEISVQEFFGALDEFLLAHRLRMPADVAILIKALITLEKLIRNLNAPIRLLDYLLPRFQKLVQESLSAPALKKRTKTWMHLAWDYGAETHQVLFRVLKNTETLQLETFRRNKSQEIQMYRLEKVLYRGILGLVAASALIGSSILIAISPQQGGIIWWMGIAGWAGAFLFAAFLSSTILTMNRSPKEDRASPDTQRFS